MVKVVFLFFVCVCCFFSGAEKKKKVVEKMEKKRFGLFFAKSFFCFFSGLVGKAP